MTLKDRISEDLKAAMKSGDKSRLETLRTLRAALMEREIEKRGGGGPITPDDEVAVLTSAAKRRKESIESFQQGGRQDLVEQETRELAIIREYLPQQLSREDVERVIATIISSAGAAAAADFGRVMPLVMKELKGKADGRLIQELVKKSLGMA
jgi:uncharacterized protein YqeY